MKKRVLCILLLFMGSSLSSAATHTGIIVGNHTISSDSDCVKGNGRVRQEKRSPGSFQRIHVSGAFTLKLSCKQNSTAVLTMDGNILPLIRTSVYNGTLTISADQSVCVDDPLQISLTTPQILQLVADGANDIRIDCTSGYDIMDIILGGSSTLQLSGQGRQLTAQLTEAAELYAEDNNVQRVRITADGSATAVVNATNIITARSSDASEIYYNDTVTHIQKAVLDAGEILPLSER